MTFLSPSWSARQAWFEIGFGERLSTRCRWRREPTATRSSLSSTACRDFSKKRSQHEADHAGDLQYAAARVRLDDIEVVQVPEADRTVMRGSHESLRRSKQAIRLCKRVTCCERMICRSRTLSRCSSRVADGRIGLCAPFTRHTQTRLSLPAENILSPRNWAWKAQPVWPWAAW